MSAKQFRFEDLEIWRKAADFSGLLFQIADKLDEKRKHRFAEQLRAAGLSITNNIAEGSGSVSDPDFANFLNISRRSVFEVANILILLTRERYLDPKEIVPILNELEEESRMLIAFMRTLRS
ncbi:MAG TPA: four helix bundle protein [Chthoniobacteraceae bacterium]|nr:four helix bundle protein [Chthoniobacteraceae bacterium]